MSLRRPSLLPPLLALAVLLGACTPDDQPLAPKLGKPQFSQFPGNGPEKITFNSNRTGNPEVFVMNPDGSVQSAKVDFGKANSHPNWRIFAEACERAVKKSSPLRMPPEKPYEAWKEMTLVFHGKEMAHL